MAADGLYLHISPDAHRVRDCFAAAPVLLTLRFGSESPPAARGLDRSTIDRIRVETGASFSLNADGSISIFARSPSAVGAARQRLELLLFGENGSFLSVGRVIE